MYKYITLIVVDYRLIHIISCSWNISGPDDNLLFRKLSLNYYCKSCWLLNCQNNPKNKLMFEIKPSALNVKTSTEIENRNI